MPVDLTHPLVADYLHRLAAAAVVLPPGRRSDLVAEIRDHLTDALAGVEPDGDESVVRAVLDRLGSPDEIVAAEPYHTPSAPPAWPGPSSGRWGPVEVIAVVALTVGTFVLPVVGPLIGVVCAWMSQQWTLREKVIATVWGVMTPLLLVAVAVGGLFAMTSASSPSVTSSFEVVQTPMVEVSP